MDARFGKISVCKAGGTAGRNAKTYKIALPSSWVKELGLDGSERKVRLEFDGRTINIVPEQSIDRYLNERTAAGHDLLELRYYDGNALCTLIYADRTAKDLRAENYTDLAVKTAFGKNQLPTWEELEAFLEERCVPRRRDGIREYLETIGVAEYDPWEIIRVTHGRMAEDGQHIEVKQL